MKLLYTCLCQLLLLPAIGQWTPAMQDYTDSLMRANYLSTEPGAVILIAQEGEVLFSKGYGLASVELQVAAEPKHVFAIGSMSKQFTAICLLQLQEKGKIQLDDPIRKYLPEYPETGNQITIRHLLTHTSGIKSFTELDTFATLVNTDLSTWEMTSLFMHEPLMFEPGSDWSYSNSGYHLAGMIIEKVSGMPLADYLKTYIFKPLGMYYSTTGNHQKIVTHKASGYDLGPSGYMPTREYSWSWPFAAGAILSNVTDLLIWDESFYSEKLLTHKTLQEVFEPYLLSNGQSSHYAMGWGVNTYNNYTFIRHGGAIGGFLSDAVRIPEEHLYIVVLSNNTLKSPGVIIDKLCNKLTQLQIENTPATPLPASAEMYTGVYQVNRLGGRLASNYSAEPIYKYITIEGDQLYMQNSGGSKQELNFIGDHTFFGQNPYHRIRFVLDESSAVTALQVIELPSSFGPDEFQLKTDLPLPTDKQEIVLDELVLSRYTGLYDFGQGFQIRVTQEGTRLFAQATGQSRFEIFAQSEYEFFLKIVDASITFEIDEEGVTTHMVLHQNGNHRAQKIE